MIGTFKGRFSRDWKLALLWLCMAAATHAQTSFVSNIGTQLWDVSQNGKQSHALSWFQAETFRRDYLLTDGNGTPLDLSATNLVIYWDVMAATNYESAWIASTGVIVNGTSGHIRISATPEESNLQTQYYFGFVRAVQIVGTNEIQRGVLVPQSIQVKFSADSRYYSTHGPLSYSIAAIDVLSNYVDTLLSDTNNAKKTETNTFTASQYFQGDLHLAIDSDIIKTNLTHGLVVGSGSASGGVLIGSGSAGGEGTAVGVETHADSCGAAVGDHANASYDGAAVGRTANATRWGSSLGAYANSESTNSNQNIDCANVAVGAFATTMTGANRQAYGPRVSNDLDHTTRFRWTPYFDEATNIYIRSSFGSGDWIDMFAWLRGIELNIETGTVKATGAQDVFGIKTFRDTLRASEITAPAGTSAGSNLVVHGADSQGSGGSLTVRGGKGNSGSGAPMYIMQSSDNAPIYIQDENSNSIAVIVSNKVTFLQGVDLGGNILSNGTIRGDISGATNPPSAWTNDQTAVVVGGGVTTTTAGNVKSYILGTYLTAAGGTVAALQVNSNIVINEGGTAWYLGGAPGQFFISAEGDFAEDDKGPPLLVLDSTNGSLHLLTAGANYYGGGFGLTGFNPEALNVATSFVRHGADSKIGPLVFGNYEQSQDAILDFEVASTGNRFRLRTRDNDVLELTQPNGYVLTFERSGSTTEINGHGNHFTNIVLDPITPTNAYEDAALSGTNFLITRAMGPFIKITPTNNYQIGLGTDWGTTHGGIIRLLIPSNAYTVTWGPLVSSSWTNIGSATGPWSVILCDKSSVETNADVYRLK